jgi:hypothetical protein
MTIAEVHPPLPEMSIKRVLATRDRLVGALAPFIDTTLKGSNFASFVAQLHAALPNNILKNIVHASVKSLVGRKLTRSMLVATCWRMAGNLPELACQRPVTQWLHQACFEWVPARVCDVYMHKQSKQYVNTFTFQSLAGTVVPKKLTQTWSLKKTQYLATYRSDKGLGFGFNRSRINGRGEQRNQGLYLDVHQFYGLQCFLLLDPKRSQQDPFVVEIGHSHATMTHNRQLINGRDRSQTPCLKGYPETQECFHCPYGTDQCALATHLLTYKKGKCKRCEQLSFLNSLETDYIGYCITCADIERKA